METGEHGGRIHAGYKPCQKVRWVLAQHVVVAQDDPCRTSCSKGTAHLVPLLLQLPVVLFFFLAPVVHALEGTSQKSAGSWLSPDLPAVVAWALRRHTDCEGQILGIEKRSENCAASMTNSRLRR